VTDMRPLFLLTVAAILLQAACRDDRAPAVQDVNVAAAEHFVDAFYSFDGDRLKSTLTSARDSVPSIVYYQGWAAGGHYSIVTRRPCVPEGIASASCSITVKDDLMRALGIPFDVTDTFHVTFANGQIVAVRTSSNDLKVFNDAEEWVRRKRPELVKQPCQGYFEGGPTPELCVQAMVRGYAEFATSDDFPDDPMKELAK